jgi:phosphoribosylformylglycinamidine synthase I
MATVRAVVLRAPGTNCDGETCFALEQAGARVDALHLSTLKEAPHRLRNYGLLVVPGGFTYGDDVGAGKILAQQLRHYLLAELLRFYEEDKLILGICNGFQALLKAGLLPFPESLTHGKTPKPEATLTYNESGRFEDRWVFLEVEGGDRCVFLRGTRNLELPVAHAEGRFTVTNPELLAQWQARGCTFLRYQLPPWLPLSPGRVPYPWNPNGSEADVAGLSDPKGTILGLMPHPERNVLPEQHPSWFRPRRPGELPGSGQQLFRNAVAYLR